jgi:hypothetical protein
MKDTKQNLIRVIEGLPVEKLEVLYRFAEWLDEDNNLSPRELKAILQGKEQFKKGEYVFLEEIRR